MFIKSSFSSPTQLGICDFSFLRFINKHFWNRKWIVHRSAFIFLLYERLFILQTVKLKVKRRIQNLKCIIFRFFPIVIRVCNPWFYEWITSTYEARFPNTFRLIRPFLLSFSLLILNESIFPLWKFQISVSKGNFIFFIRKWITSTNKTVSTSCFL